MADGQEKVYSKHFDYEPRDAASTAVPPLASQKRFFTLVKTFNFHTCLLNTSNFHTYFYFLFSLTIRPKNYYFYGSCCKNHTGLFVKRDGLLQVLTISILRFLFFNIHTVPTSPQALFLQPNYDQGARHSHPNTQYLQSLLVAWPLNVMLPLQAQTLKTCQGYSSRGFTGVISPLFHQLSTGSLSLSSVFPQKYYKS